MSHAPEEHECEPGEQVAGIVVTLHLDLIRPLWPTRDEATVRAMLLRHAPAIAARMVGAGAEAAAHLFDFDGGDA